MTPTSKNYLAVLAGFAIAVPAGWLLADEAKDIERAERVEERLAERIEGDEAFLKELLEKAAQGGGGLKLELEGEEAERFLNGDGGELADRLLEALRGAESLDAEGLERELSRNPDARRLELDSDGRGMRDFLRFFQGQMEGRQPSRNEKEHRSALSEWKGVVAKASSATAEVLDGDGEQIALATVVDARGYLVSKASELPAGRVTVAFGNGTKLKAKQLDVNKSWDLALLKVPGDGLAAVEFAESEELPLGSFLAAPGTGELPLATGVASVAPRNLSLFERGFLGIGMEDDGDAVRVSEVFGRSAAARAGLRAGDEIVSINGVAIEGSAQLALMVGGKAPGEKLTIRYRRGDDESDLDIELGRRERPTGGRVEMPQMGELMGGRLSETRDEFPNALQHDLTLAPEECGGPLVNLDGRVVGVNIARGGRVKSYAIPAADLKMLLGDLDAGRFAFADAREAQRELEQIDREIEEIERRLKRARERREAAQEALEKE